MIFRGKSCRIWFNTDLSGKVYIERIQQPTSTQESDLANNTMPSGINAAAVIDGDDLASFIRHLLAHGFVTPP